MELTRAERRERVKNFHAHIARKAAELQAEAYPAETDPPGPQLAPIANVVIADAAEIAFLDLRITVDKIQRIVCKEFGISRSEICSGRRHSNVVRPRHIAMYLSKHMTDRSLPQIGRMFGNRDHTTILHAIRKIEQCMEADADLAAIVMALEQRISESL